MDGLSKRSNSGFTIVELVIIIVVIAIIAVITIVSYGSVVENAIKLSLTSDLVNASDQIKLYQSDHAGNLPNSIGCPSNDATGQLCVNATKDNEFVEYHADNILNPKTFQLSAKNGDKYRYRIASGSNEPLPCPVGYIIVPGSKTYGTEDFCVMKYEAKDNGQGLPVSKFDGDYLIWYSQIDAKEASALSCDSCHLITESEWMTISQNIANNKYNWVSGVVGDGLMYNGHSDYDPYSVISTASLDDSDGYFGTNNSSSSSQRRTYRLSNGETIWDFSGNLTEWTSGTYNGGQPGVDGGGFDWREYINLTNSGSLGVNPMPSGTKIAGSELWTMVNNNIGKIISDSDYSSEFGMRRGGNWLNLGSAGIFSVQMVHAPQTSGSDTGFRVSR